MKKMSLLLAACISLSGLLLYACGGGGGSSSGGASAAAGSGTVALFATDDISNFQQVKATVASVQLVHAGSNTTCDVLTTPETFDLSDLSSLFELLGTTTCTARPYNRLRIEFEKAVALTDNTGFTNEPCSFSS